MRGIICYYSSTGNTRLACRYIEHQIPGVDFDLWDITKRDDIAFEAYDIAGFATFTDFLGPPRVFQTFLRCLPRRDGQFAFVFNTFGSLSGRTLKVLEKRVSAKGFRVIAGHSLHTPESYPPMIARGKGHETSPTGKELVAFDEFVADLGMLLREIGEGASIPRRRIQVGALNSVAPVLPRTTARNDMGNKHVDEGLCTECGVCAKGCPYGAIRLAPKPEFDDGKCYGCWRCYNRCPVRAIYTRKLRGTSHYPNPIEPLRRKLSR